MPVLRTAVKHAVEACVAGQAGTVAERRCRGEGGIHGASLGVCGWRYSPHSDMDAEEGWAGLRPAPQRQQQQQASCGRAGVGPVAGALQVRPCSSVAPSMALTPLPPDPPPSTVSRGLPERHPALGVDLGRHGRSTPCVDGVVQDAVMKGWSQRVRRGSVPRAERVPGRGRLAPAHVKTGCPMSAKRRWLPLLCLVLAGCSQLENPGNVTAADKAARAPASDGEAHGVDQCGRCTATASAAAQPGGSAVAAGAA